MYLETRVRQVRIHASWVAIQVLNHGLEIRLAQELACLQGLH